MLKLGYLRVLLATCRLHLGQSWSRATFKFCILFQPLFYSFVFYYMYRDSGIPYYANYVILGSGITSLWSAMCFSSAGDIERERFMGTLENLFAAPVPFGVVLWGKVLANTLLGLSGTLVSLALIVGLLGGRFYIEHPLWFIAAFLLMLFSFLAIALFIAPIFTLSRNARVLMNCLEYPAFILCGMVFPISLLPRWVHPVSYLLAPTWTVELVRQAAGGIPDSRRYLLEMAVALGLSLGYLLLGKRLLKQIDLKTRIEATLGVS